MNLSRFSVVIGFAATLAIAPSLHAQTVVNPNTAEFDPSADHNATLPDGSAAVQSYQLELYLQGASAPFQTSSLGKPAPQTDGKIRVNLATVLVPLPTPGTIYTADVAAVGPGGTSRSAQSNAFSWAAPCTYTVAPLTQSFSASSGTGSATVTTAAGCAWTAAANNTWISVSNGTNRSGTGTVNYSVVANALTTARNGSITIAGQTLAITQSGLVCSFTISASSASVGASGGTGTVNVTANGGTCAWTATSPAGWVTITSGASGTGNGTVAFSAAANTATTTRSATLTIAGRPFAVNQAAAPSAPTAPTNLRILTN